MTKDTKYLILLALLYFAVSFVGILHHELWLDEAQHWLLARDSNSVSELVQNIRLEGHPLLWSLMLFFITRFTSDPFWMQLLHILISTTAVIVFLRKAPFDGLFKVLFIFGYFMVFEYNLISRNYSLGILFLFLACTLFEKREQRFSSICLLLALAMNTHLLFSVPAFALFLTLLVEQIQNRQFFKNRFLAGYFVFAVGLLLILIQIKTTDSDWLLDPINQLPFEERIVDGYVSFFKGIIAVPDFRTIHFWNTNLVVNWSKPLAAILALLIYLLPLVLFFKNRKTLFFIYSALIGTQIFFFITQRSATRFHGMTFMLIIIGLWMEHYYSQEDSKLKRFLTSIKLALFQKPIIYTILLIHFCSGIYAYSMDFKYPFASAKQAVDYLKNRKTNTKKIVSISCEGTLVSAYLERKIYFLLEGSNESFCHWDSNFSCLNNKSIIEMLSAYAAAEHSFVCVSNQPINGIPQYMWTPANDKIRIRLLEGFHQAIIPNMDYYIYEVSKIQE